MVVHPAPGHPEGTLVNAVLHHCGLPALDLAPGQAAPDALSNWPGAPAAARLRAAFQLAAATPRAITSPTASDKLLPVTITLSTASNKLVHGCRTAKVLCALANLCIPHAGMNRTAAEIRHPLLCYYNWGVHARRWLTVSRCD